MILTRLYNQIVTSFRLCLIEIWSNRLRSFITSFGIFLGIASYIINIAFIRGIDNDIKKNLDRIGGLDIITIKKKVSATEEEVINLSKSSGIKINEIDEISKSLPYVQFPLPLVDIPWSILSAAGKKSYAKPFAVCSEYLSTYNYEVQEGRLLTSNDHNQKLSVCIIGQRVVKSLFPNEKSVLGKSISILNHQFTIVGVIKTENEFEYKAIQIIFPYSFYIYKFGSENNSLDEIAVKLKNSSYAEKARIDFTLLLKQKHRGIEDFEIELNQTKIEEMRSAQKGIKILLISIAAITLLMGGISIMNIMFAAIGDRIREIGIRKALGARRSDIFLQFVIEAIMVCFVGGLPGMILGTMIIFFPKGIFPFDPSLSIYDLTFAFVFTLTAGILSGVSPAIRAASMQPVEALRY